MLFLQIYSLLLLSIVTISSLSSKDKDERIGAFILAPIVAYIIITMRN